MSLQDRSYILKTTPKNNGVIISNFKMEMHRGKQCPLPPGHLLSFRPKQLAANAHGETSRSVIITPIFGLGNVNKCPTLSETKQKARERSCKTSDPRSEYNKRTSINCHKYKPGNNIWVLNEIKLYFIHRISLAWAFSFRNNVATMLQRCAILQTVKTDVFFQIGSFFYVNLPCNLRNSDTFYSKFFAKLSKLSPTRRSFFSTIDCLPSRMSTIAVLTPPIGQFGKSNNSKSYEWPHLSLNSCGYLLIIRNRFSFFKSGRNYEIRQWQIRYQCPGGWVHLELTESLRILYNFLIVHSNLAIFYVRSRLLLASSQKLTTLCSL